MSLKGKRVLFFAAAQYEELWYLPRRVGAYFCEDPAR